MILIAVCSYLSTISLGIWANLDVNETPGSILLPATRRGKYLANIVRREATDGTEIRFSRDADRLNAEARQKADVLGEELLPYIIAEQERRAALHRRVMAAIQSGERGVTIAEMRNKPPVFIKKGLFYRCPKNRPPIEPDASGNITCQGDIKPSQIIYDSCLSAEDRELYKTENTTFFCNRRNKSDVEASLGRANKDSSPLCPPSERTWLNYTQAECALEESYDVVVHYRYYADKMNKQTLELDPDREVCDHWAPCQVGYLFELPTPDTAVFVPELYQDIKKEFAVLGAPYRTSPRIVKIPEGQSLIGVKYIDDKGKMKDLPNHMVKTTILRTRRGETTLSIELIFPILTNNFLTSYHTCLTNHKCEFLTQLAATIVRMQTKELAVTPGQILDELRFSIGWTKDESCTLEGVTFRNKNGELKNLDRHKYRRSDEDYLYLKLGEVGPADFGEYFAAFAMYTTAEEQSIRFLTLEASTERKNKH